jgi:hypothetical protein
MWALKYVYQRTDSNEIQNQFCGPVLWDCGPGSSVGIGTGHGLDGPGIEFRWWRDFPHLAIPAVGPTQHPVQWVPDLSPGVKERPGVTLNPHPLLVPLVMKE